MRAPAYPFRIVQRFHIDLFAFALGALTLLGATFFADRNAAALLMVALCFAGLLAARLAGFSNRALVPLAGGLVVILWMVWIDSPASPRRTSALAHAAGGMLVAWALCEYLRARMSWPGWGKVALAAVLVLTLVWELGELVGDTLIGTSLQPDLSDSVLDVLLGTAGGLTAVGLAWLLAPGGARERDPAPESPAQRR